MTWTSGSSSDVDEFDNAHTTAWMSTTASQIFFMQLGFLCYEVGYVKDVWTQSVILKNIEDTFVGVLIFLAFGYTLSASDDTVYGIISVPKNPFLIGIPTKEHDQILISAFFASTCATIISGAILERMKNKAYIMWCLLTILVNYSFVAHWVWHKHGWLNELGFVDGAGSVVVHSTAGMAALVAVWKLGPRRDSVDSEGNLLPTENAAKPIINAIGAFFLWYGWFAFNVSSPIAFSKGIGDAIGTTALVTVISPISSSASAFAWMHLGWVQLSFESLLNCLLAGLVAITGACHTTNPHEAVFIGIFASVVYFLSSYMIREKWKLDDPLQVIAIHLCCGIYSGIVEGIVGNNVYGTPGLIRGGGEHFGIQLLGVLVIVGFNACLSLFMYHVLLERLIFRDISIRVSILDIYLGTRLFDQNYDMALDEVLNCTTSVAKQMLWEFHKFLEDRYASEQLNFLIVAKIYGQYLERNQLSAKPDKMQAARYILRIVHTYIDENGSQCINVSGKQRQILKRITHQLLIEIKEKRAEEDAKMKAQDSNENKDGEEVATAKKAKDDSPGLTAFDGARTGLDISTEDLFKGVSGAVWKLVIPHFTHFLQQNFDMEKKPKFEVKLPFKLDKNWVIEWDEALMKEVETVYLADAVPIYNNSATLLSKLLAQYDNVQEEPYHTGQYASGGRLTPVYKKEREKRSSSVLQQIQLSEVGKDVNDDDKGSNNAVVVVIE
eukprot:319414_1